jgi:hypothetical protein
MGWSRPEAGATLDSQHSYSAPDYEVHSADEVRYRGRPHTSPM